MGYPKKLDSKPLLKPLEGKYVTVRKKNGIVLTKEECQKWKILYVPDYLGEPALAFTFTKDGQLSSYNVKPSSYPNPKKCYIQGDIANSDMFGCHTHSDPENRNLVVTEGMEDCVKAARMVGPAGYNYTSLPHGTNSVENFIKANYNKLIKYKSIILSFDQDDAGQEAISKFISLFNHLGKVRVAKYDLKDACEMELAGKETDYKWAVIKSEVYKPKNIITDLTDLLPQILTKPTYGRPWPWKGLNDINHGAYLGRKILFAAPTDAGKTSIVKHILFHFTGTDPVWKGGLFFLEQKVTEIVHKLLGGKVNEDLEQPDTEWWDTDKLTELTKDLSKTTYFYDPQYGINLKDIIDSIYYFVNVNKIQFVIIDNLTILSSDCKIDGKRVSKEDFFNEVGVRLDRIALELNVMIILVGHMNRNSIGRKVALGTRADTLESYEDKSASKMYETYNKLGLTWESGRIGTIDDIDGGKTAGRLFHEIWVGSRNTVSPDPFERNVFRLDVLKCKNRARNSKRFIELYYDDKDGTYKEVNLSND